MKTKIQVIELTHEEIVNIFSTASYDNYLLELSYGDSMDDLAREVKKKWNETHGDTMCYEDKLAAILENGGTIAAVDKEEYEYGSYEGEEPTKENHVYPITMKSLLDACSTTEGYSYAKRLLKDEEGDIYDAWNIIQIAMFGEVIYG